MAEQLEVRQMLSAGDLDPTFGTDGFVETPIELGSLAKAVAIDSHGRIIASGQMGPFSGPVEAAVVRYETDGSLDPTFNGTGIQTTSFFPSNYILSGMAIQSSDDKVVLVGKAFTDSTASWDFVITRYNTDGSLDAGFGNAGIVKTTLQETFVDAYTDTCDVAIAPEGKIVVAGRFRTNNASDIVVARYNSDGTPDSTFDADGLLVTSFGPNDDWAYSVAVQPDGKVLVGGQMFMGSSYGTGVLRLNLDGSRDTDFGVNGLATVNVHQYGTATGVDMVLQGDGKIVTSGQAADDSLTGSTRSHFALARFNSDGMPDASFGTNGAVATVILGTHISIAWSVAIQQNGRIIVGGVAGLGSDSQAVLARYNTDGSLDATFDGDGIVTYDLGNPSNPLARRGVAVQGDGNIVLAGLAWNVDGVPRERIRLSRHLGDPVIPPNTAPVANDDWVTTDEDSAITFDVLGNDTDSENNVLASSTIPLTSPSAGSLTNNGDGTFTYDPGSAFQHLAVGKSAMVTFDYRVFDALGEHDDGTVTITINGANDTPSVAVANASVAVNEGQSASNSGWWSDIDASDVVTLNASVGSVTRNADGTWSWSFNTNDGPGQSQIVTVAATDLSGAVSNTTFQLSVNNVVPVVAVSGPVSTLAGTAVNFTLGATDISSADQAAGFTYQIDWDGDGFVDQTVAGADGLVVGHSFASAGLTNVIVTATDKDGGTSSPVTHSILVIQPVNIDVKPDSSQNKVNAKSQGVIPVAILTTAGFDATTVIGSSVQLASVSAKHFALEDVDGDGDRDMILHFRTQEVLNALGLSLNSGDSVNVGVQLTGETIDHVMIEGIDTINFFLTGHGSGKNK